ncbi:MAG: serine/threonine-protein kinase HipA [Solirubrobacteraceae bacterium]|nr:serine/threonine-protein kinase HipA [Solirubrobacteraceae bacterium]
MTSDRPREAFVWIWLPGASEPVVAGRLEEVGGEVSLVYGRSYLARDDTIALYTPELPLREGRIRPLPGLDAPGCILDARPDAWGQRVIMNRLIGAEAAQTDPADLGLLQFLLESGSDRIGALDFQASPERYIARSRGNTTLDELAASAQRVEDGLPLSPALDAALLHGSSVGGARPKALIDDGPRTLIAKFSSSTDTYAVVQGEYVAMELARRAGLSVAPVQLATALDKTVLLVERFDRVPGSADRRAIVSSLTILELNELAARWASYADLAQVIRERFTMPAATLVELFARITFSILVGNTDDHARNHAAFWDGEMLTLTPAYDICPQLRSGGEAAQAMIIGDESDRFKLSQVAGCVQRAHLYQLTQTEARDIVDHQIDVIEKQWRDVCDQAGLPDVERKRFWKRQFLHPFALEGYQRTPPSRLRSEERPGRNTLRGNHG